MESLNWCSKELYYPFGTISHQSIRLEPLAVVQSVLQNFKRNEAPYRVKSSLLVQDIRTQHWHLSREMELSLSQALNSSDWCFRTVLLFNSQKLLKAFNADLITDMYIVDMIDTQYKIYGRFFIACDNPNGCMVVDFARNTEGKNITSG